MVLVAILVVGFEITHWDNFFVHGSTGRPASLIFGYRGVLLRSRTVFENATTVYALINVMNLANCLVQ